MKQSIKRISAVLAMAMALSAFSAFGVFAEGESTAPASAPQSTSTSQIANVEQQTESVSQGNGDGSSNGESEGNSGSSEAEPTPLPSQLEIGSYNVDFKDYGSRDNMWEWGEKADVEVYLNLLEGETIQSSRFINSGAFTADSVNFQGTVNGNKVIFPHVTYNGGGNELSFEITTNLRGVLTGTQLIAQCLDVNPNPPEPTPTPEPVPTEKPEYDYPKILVKDFSFGGNSVEAGKEFTLELTLFTTSGNANLQDVMVGLNFGELKGVSLASGSMNTYVGEMAPNTTKTISYKMITDATIEPGAISINVNLTSKNGEAATAPISIPVTQPERFDITNMEAPETIMMGEEGYLSVTFVNKGKSAINNLSAEIQGENLANPGQSQFLGNIAAGTENSVDFSVMAAAEGTINGKVILSYEDAKGEVKTLEKEFSCTVEPMMDMNVDPMDPGMMDPTMTETTPGMPIWGWALIVVGVVAVVVVVVVVIKKKQKAKKMAQLEDEDEDI